MSLADTVDRLTNSYGARCVYTRHTRAAVSATPWKAQADSTSSVSDIPCTIRHYRPQEIAGLVQEGDQLLTIPASALATPPTKGDTVSVDGGPSLTVAYSRVGRVGADEAVYKITVRGAS